MSISELHDGIAYSYIRFSTPEQRKGGSLRRQTADAASFCERNKLRLDTSTTFHDLGKSAFLGEHRKNPDRNALAAFLKLVEDDKIPKGSYLIVEGLDRLTREDIQPALLLILNLLQKGIRIVQLKPVEMVYDDKSPVHAIMLMVVELSRGHSESEMKKVRNSATWQEKLSKAREGKPQPPRRKDGRLTNHLSRYPAWLKEHNSKLEKIPARVAVVQRIFHLAANGNGMAAIVKRLTTENVPAFGDREEYTDEEGTVRKRATNGSYGAGVWVRAYVAKILKDRRALGEHQPCGKGRKPTGDVIKDYFPAIVTEDEFNAARRGALERKAKPGRVSEHVNIFAGLLKNAKDENGKDTFFVTKKAESKGGQRILANTAGAEGRATYESFPADVFERAILSRMREIDPHSILNGDSKPDESVVLAGEFARVESELAEINAFMDANGGYSPTLGKRVVTLEALKRELGEKLAIAQQQATYPLSAAWGECQTLAGALDKAKESGEVAERDARLRLRSALRRIVDSIWLVVVPRGQWRLCECQVRFTGWEKYRVYSIIYRAKRSVGKGKGKRLEEGCYCCHALNHPEAAMEGMPFNQWDPTNADDVDNVRIALERYPVEWIEKLLREDGLPLP